MKEHVQKVASVFSFSLAVHTTDPFRVACICMNITAHQLLKSSTSGSLLCHHRNKFKITAARLVLNSGERDHVAAALKERHWLPVIRPC
jgi:hypothetical protein